MRIAENAVVTIDYTLKNNEGLVLDTSEGRESLMYLHGVGGLIPGLEKELEGKDKGDSFNLVVEPKDAYGERSEDNMNIVPLEGFKAEGDEQLEVGMQVQVESEHGPQIAIVAKIDGEDVTLDLNHVLAGATLHFDVEVKDVRQATEDEKSHGHAHGVGGHQH